MTRKQFCVTTFGILAVILFAEVNTNPHNSLVKTSDFICSDEDGNPINGDGNYVNPSDCNSFLQCSDGRVFISACPSTSFYNIYPDICGYQEDNLQCPNYWAADYRPTIDSDGCPDEVQRWSGNPILRLPTLKQDNCTTYTECYATYSDGNPTKPPQEQSCYPNFFFSIQHFGCYPTF